MEIDQALHALKVRNQVAHEGYLPSDAERSLCEMSSRRFSGWRGLRRSRVHSFAVEHANCTLGTKAGIHSRQNYARVNGVGARAVFGDSRCH